MRTYTVVRLTPRERDRVVAALAAEHQYDLPVKGRTHRVWTHAGHCLRDVVAYSAVRGYTAALSAELAETIAAVCERQGEAALAARFRDQRRPITHNARGNWALVRTAGGAA